MIDSAIKKYIEFHQFEPTNIEEFDCDIPRFAYEAGNALFVLYRSGKKDPVTLITPVEPVDYIHEHDSGVKVYRTDEEVGPDRSVPKRISDVEAITKLGDCLGFAYLDPEGVEVVAECSAPLPELYCTPSGKALLVIENKENVAALIWGGKLRVEPRGIVG